MNSPITVLLAGPTASGKSALAIHLAEHLGGIIVNADSMQVYADLKILTARPGDDDMARVPHRLFGFVDAAEHYSVGRFLDDVAPVLHEADAAGQPVIFVGGTGLYFNALQDGLAPVPPVKADVRAHWRAVAAARGPAVLAAALRDKDPVMADRLAATDSQRLVRALEVIDSTGRSLAEWQQASGFGLLTGRRLVRLLLTPPRDVLRSRTSERFDRMLDSGAPAEAAALAQRNLDPALPAMRAIGVAPLIAAARGEMAWDAAVARAKTDTHHYIKRQETWFRKYMISWRGISEQQIERQVAQIFSFIES